MIAALLAKGTKVGVSFDGRKAVDDLLAEAVEGLIAGFMGEQKDGVKRSRDDDTCLNGAVIRDVINKQAIRPR